MSDPRPTPTESTSVTRRRFLEIGGAGVAAGSLLTMLDARQAPAQIKGTNLRMLLWSHYVPAYDVWFDKFTKEWGDKTGVKVRVDHMPHLELPARYAAEFAAGSGHDLERFASPERQGPPPGCRSAQHEGDRPGPWRRGEVGRSADCRDGY